MALDVLIVGSGGRETALAWKVAQSPQLGKLYIAPGNGGTRQYGENVPIPATAIETLGQFAQEHSIDLTIVGPDEPLALGIVDVFKARGLKIFGPSKMAAQIEASKAFAKNLMQEAGVPTAEFAVFTDYKLALKYVRERGAPTVIKASGLALGKGVYVCTALTQAEEVLKKIMVDRIHGDAGNQVVIEEYLEGAEISIHVFSDGKHFKMLPPAQDHKRIGENDTGPNTGGMGAIVPVPWVSPEMTKRIEETIVRPTLEVLAYRNTPFVGMLYPGIKLTSRGPKVLEFNVRWGDPETQAYLRLMKNDILDLCLACVNGTLNRHTLEWLPQFAANVVLASEGYPGEYEKGFLIEGIEDAEKIPNVIVFQAGSKYADGIVKTSGGRVLGVSALGDSLKDVLKNAYKGVELIQYPGKYYRRDIGTRSGIHKIGSNSHSV
jgi:phosphoribosylamine--glycine ligase